MVRQCRDRRAVGDVSGSRNLWELRLSPIPTLFGFQDALMKPISRKLIAEELGSAYLLQSDRAGRLPLAQDKAKTASHQIIGEGSR